MPSFEAPGEFGDPLHAPAGKASQKALSNPKVPRILPLDSEKTLEYRPRGERTKPLDAELKLNPLPYLSDLSPEHGLVRADPPPRYAEVAFRSDQEDAPLDLETPFRAELTPDTASNPNWKSEPRTVPVLHPPPKPAAPSPRAARSPEIDDRLTPRELTPESDEEYHPPLGDLVSASAITKLPDVKRALEALRAGRMVKPAGTEPYATPSSVDSKPTIVDRVPPSEPPVALPKSARPRAAQSLAPTLSIEPARREDRSLKVPWLGLLAVAGWAAAVVATLVPVFRSEPQGLPVSAPGPSLSVPVAAPSVVPPSSAAEGPVRPETLQWIAETPASELIPDQWILLANERARKRREELEQLVSDLEPNGEGPPLAATVTRLSEAARDQRTAAQALLAMTRLRGSLGPDLVYRVAADTRLPADTRELALELLGTKSVRSQSSEALKVVLDLGSAQDCDQVKETVERAMGAGDQRALEPLGRFSRTYGCGPAKTQDCYPCLRPGGLLYRALQVVRSRPPPTGGEDAGTAADSRGGSMSSQSRSQQRTGASSPVGASPGR